MKSLTDGRKLIDMNSGLDIDYEVHYDNGPHSQHQQMFIYNPMCLLFTRKPIITICFQIIKLVEQIITEIHDIHFYKQMEIVLCMQY